MREDSKPVPKSYLPVYLLRSPPVSLCLHLSSVKYQDKISSTRVSGEGTVKDQEAGLGLGMKTLQTVKE